MIEKLTQYDLFRSVDKDDLNAMIANRDIVERSYAKGRTMHQKGSICQGVHLLCSGKLVAYALAANGSETIVFEFEPGDVVGTSFLFGEEKRFPLNVFCTSDCRLIYISREAVLRLLSNYGFTLAFIRALTLNAQRMNQKISIYTRGSLRKNLMDYLSALSVEQQSVTVSLPMTKKELADYFCVQRPSLFRELKRMKDEGLIAINNREITLRFTNGKA